MKTDFSINVKVNLGVTPELAQLVSAILGHTPTITQSADAEVLPDANTQVEDKPKDEEQVAPAEPGATTEVADPAEAAEKAPTKYTAEDVRAAMHRTRQRIEGEDYKEHTDSEAYKKYHKTLTGQFKNIAALLGADKPSALPAEKIGSFIAQCDDLIVLDDGTVGSSVPF